jgi:hypothetical protein
MHMHLQTGEGFLEAIREIPLLSRYKQAEFTAIWGNLQILLVPLCEKRADFGHSPPGSLVSVVQQYPEGQ